MGGSVAMETASVALARGFTGLRVVTVSHCDRCGDIEFREVRSLLSKKWWRETWPSVVVALSLCSEPVVKFAGRGVQNVWPGR